MPSSQNQRFNLDRRLKVIRAHKTEMLLVINRHEIFYTQTDNNKKLHV